MIFRRNQNKQFIYILISLIIFLISILLIVLYFSLPFVENQGVALVGIGTFLIFVSFIILIVGIAFKDDYIEFGDEYILWYQRKRVVNSLKVEKIEHIYVPIELKEENKKRGRRIYFFTNINSRTVNGTSLILEYLDRKYYKLITYYKSYDEIKILKAKVMINKDNMKKEW